MTYNEFKEWCDNNHFLCEEYEGCLHVFSEDGNGKVGLVSMTNRYNMEYWYFCKDMGMAFEKMAELARTPLRNRNKPKRYIVKIPSEMPNGFYALRGDGGSLYMGDDNDPDLTDEFKLTEEEIKKIDERFMVFAEEVKE